MIIIFAIIIYTLFIIPYKVTLNEFKELSLSIKETYNFFKKKFKKANKIGKVGYSILLIMISLLLLFLSFFYILSSACYNTLKKNVNSFHANVYQYFIVPYLITYYLVQFMGTDDSYGKTLGIITEYFKQLNDLFTQKSVIEFYIILIIIALISCFLYFYPKFIFSDKNTIEKHFWDLLNLFYNSSMLTIIFLAFLGLFFILTDTVTSDLTQKFNISFFDVYSTLSLYYASCILLVKIIFNLSIKLFIESRKQNDDLLQSH